MAESENSCGHEICVAIDMSGISRSALESIVLLAEWLKAGLYGLFLQDTRLQDVAKLPFTTEVTRSTGKEQALFVDSFKAHSDRLFVSVQDLFAECTLARNVKSRFEVSDEKISMTALFNQGYDIFLPANINSQSGFSTPKQPLLRVKLFYDGSAQSLRALAILEGLLTAGLTKTVYLVSFCTLPSVIIQELTKRGAQVFLINTHADKQSSLPYLVSGSQVNLQLLPFSIAMDMGGDVLLRELERYQTEPTFLVS